MPPDATVCAELERLLQKIRKTARRNLIVSVDNYEADVIDKYYEEQFMKKDQSLRIPEKANMQEYSERLEAIVKRWGVKKSFFKGTSLSVTRHDAVGDGLCSLVTTGNAFTIHYSMDGSVWHSTTGTQNGGTINGNAKWTAPIEH